MINKIALTAALVFGTASVALAQDADPNLLNRYPTYNGAQVSKPAFTSRNVAMTGKTTGEQQWLDRASFSTGQ